jgi:protein-tyrosine-phosphatase
MNILFVCTGNTCRSPMAAAYFKKILKNKDFFIKVYSGGIISGNKPISLQTKKVLIDNDIPLNINYSQEVTKQIIDKADLIIVMTKFHKIKLNRKFPGCESKIKLLMDFSNSNKNKDIPNPYGKSIEAYQKVFLLMKSPLNNLLTWIFPKKD